MPKFIPGLQLSKIFFEKAIKPLLAVSYPQLSYSAARLGWGSDVMGFDTAMSMDHGWGPKMTLFLAEEDFRGLNHQLEDFFAWHLPLSIRGFPTNFGEPYEDGGIMEDKANYPLHHMVTITTPERYFLDCIGFDIHQTLTAATWLTLPQQRLRTIRSGCIYHDGLGMLSNIQQKLHWYPHDLWLYLMANQWRRIDQEEPFVGRTGSVGDELGSRLIAARLVHEMMCLHFLMHQEYAPYSKWFGTAFQRLPLASKLIPLFHNILDSQNWKRRESFLSESYQILAETQNQLKVTPRITLEISPFHERPFLVPHSSRFVEALLAQITDSTIKTLPPHVGSIDQFVDNIDVLTNVNSFGCLRALYQQND